MINYIKLLFIGIFFSGGLLAQTGSIKGFVYDKESGEPIIFTNVYLEGSTYGISTDVNGFYNLTKVPAGKYVLMVTYIGYDTVQVDIVLGPAQTLTKDLFLNKGSIQLDEFVVSAEKQEMTTEVRTSLIKITPKQLTRIPTVGAEPDLAQYLQILPGVIFTGDQGGQLYIRGGSPIQNKVLLDGMVIYNPFHSIGLFSVFDSDIIRNADVYTGGFSAEYGGRISSIMDITTKDGNKRKHKGKLSSSTFSSKLLLEGPLMKQTDDGNGSLSYILSAKTSYLDQTSKKLYSYIDGGGLPYNFTDLYGKLSLNSNGGSKINVFGFNFSDKVNYQNVSDLHWDSKGIGGNMILVPSSSSVLVKTNFSYSNYNISFQEENSMPSSSSIDGFRFGLDFVYFLGNNEFDYGIETSGSTTRYEFFNSLGRKIGRDEPVSTTELSGYLKYKFSFKKWLIEPSFRMQYYSSLSYLSPEPRLGLKYKMTDNVRFKFGGGLYSQNLVSAVSEHDVVNLFYGFLSGTFNLQDEFEGEVVSADIQKSQHAILGVEIDLSNRLMLTVEGYLKSNPQLIVINRNKIYPDSPGYNDEFYYLRKDFIIESGDAYGVDFLLKYDYKRTYIWFVYSLGKVTRYDGRYNYYPHYDRRHNMNLVASQVFGKDLNWELSARWNLGSGFPARQNQGYYELMPFLEGLSTDVTTTNGELGILYTDIDQKTRLPYYHRLDITLKRTFYLWGDSELQTLISVTNAYNRENIFYYDRITHTRVNQLPVIPSAGLSLTF
jgi:hypothetical protein